MDLPEVSVTVYLGDYAARMESDAASRKAAAVSSIEQVYFELYDLLAQSFKARCEIHLTVEPGDGRDNEVVVEMEDTTGDAEEDSDLQESLYDYTLRQLEAILQSEESRGDATADVKTTLYILRPNGEPIRAKVEYRTAVNDEYTFYSVIPYGQVRPVAILSSLSEQFVQVERKQKKPLTVFSIFDEKVKWYAASTGMPIKGALADYLNIRMRDTLL